MKTRLQLATEKQSSDLDEGDIWWGNKFSLDDARIFVLRYSTEITA